MGSGISLTPVQISEIVKREMSDNFKLRPAENEYSKYYQYLERQKYEFNIHSVDRSLLRVLTTRETPPIESI
jgi:hypothetical protein